MTVQKSAKRPWMAAMSDARKAYSLAGVEAIISSVCCDAPPAAVPRPTAKRVTPSALTAVADAIAVRSSPPVVCAPSERSHMTFGTFSRPGSVLFIRSAAASSTAPEMNVYPPVVRALIAVTSVARLSVVGTSRVAVAEKTVSDARAEYGESSSCSSRSTAKVRASAMNASIDPETSMTRARSYAAWQRGGAMGGGTVGGIGGTVAPHATLTVSMAASPL